MILTDNKIRELAKEEKLITPFEEENLQSESYDVTIGTELTVMKKKYDASTFPDKRTLTMSIGILIFLKKDILFLPKNT